MVRLRFALVLLLLTVMLGCSRPSESKGNRSPVGETAGSATQPSTSPPGHSIARRHKREHGAALAEKPDPLQTELKKLEAGKIGYFVPDTMKAWQYTRVRASVGKGQVSDATIQQQTGGGTIEPVQVSPKMKVTLEGPDFEIKPLSPDEQLVDDSTPTTWEWDVRSNTAGKHPLRLAAVVVLGDSEKEFRVLERDIIVQVSTTDAITHFLSTNWQWLAGFLVSSGVLGAIIKRFTGKKDKPSSS